MTHSNALAAETTILAAERRYRWAVIFFSVATHEGTGPMHDLTGFQRDLLYAVAGLDGPHGLAVEEELESYYEEERHHGRLYPNLDGLVDERPVEKGQRDRRINYYALTRRGNREIAARREWESQYVTPNVEV